MVKDTSTGRRGNKNRLQFCIITIKEFLSRRCSILESPVYLFVPHRTRIFH